MKKWILVAAVVPLLLMGLAYGLASSLLVGGGTVEAGAVTDVTCDERGLVFVSYTLALDGGVLEVSSVDVWDIGPNCSRKTLTVTLEHGSGGPTTRSAIVDGSSRQSIDFASANIPAANVTATHVAIHD